VSADLAGLPRILAFQLRRSWVRMLVWALALPMLVLLVNLYLTQTFPTQADRDAYAATTNTPSLAALTGLFAAANTPGGMLDTKFWMTAAVALTLATIFLVTRNGRTEEETGHTELLRQTAIGRHTISVADWLLAGGFAMITGLLCGIVGIAGGLAADGAMLMGLSYSGAAIAFLGIAAVTGQLAATSRGANASAAVLLALVYLVRAIADLNGTGDRPAWYAWLSPLGWAQQSRAFSENDWWTLAPCLALGVAGCGLAVLFERHRDLGAGIVPVRRGPTRAAALTRTVLGLPLRLQRTMLIAWVVGVAAAGAFFGGVAVRMNALLAGLDGSSPLGQAIRGGSDSGLDGLLGFCLVFLAVLITAFAIQSTLALRLDEAATGEIEWATAVSRWAWVGARIAIPTIASGLMLLVGGWLQGAVYGGQVGEPSKGGQFAVAALGYWPVIALVIAVVALAAALRPRSATALAWGLYGLIVLFAALGDVLGIPHAIVAGTPYWVVPQPGRVDPVWWPVGLMAAGALALAALALWRYRQRDQAPV
jgi:ABC-2 type transport system permease protein